MSQTDHALKSKEFKIILKSGNFSDIIKGKENVINIIKSQIQKQGGIFDDSDKEDHRYVWYLDTPNHILYEEKKFFLRMRVEFKKNGKIEYEVNLKNREEDRHKALKYDLSKPIVNPDFKYKEEPEYKFEEDIIIPLRSKFSASTNFEFEQLPKFKTWQDILNIFPNLDLSIQSDENLLPVNGFIAKEFSYKLGTIEFKDKNIAETGISLWYKMSLIEGPIEKSIKDKDFSLQSIKEKIPDIVEFDIDIKAKENLSDNGTLSYEFPSSFLEETEMFFRTMAI